MKYKMDKIINILIAFIFTYSMKLYLNSNTILNYIYFIIALMIINQTKKLDKQAKRFGYIYSFIFSIFLVLGKVIYNSNDVFTIFSSASNFFNTIIMIIGFTFILGNIFAYCIKYIESISNKKTKEIKLFNSKYSSLIIWALIFLSWIPALLAYYPGIYSYDLQFQTEEILGIRQLSMIHPPLHNMYWLICINLGYIIHLNPLTVAAIIQMIIMSMIFTYVIEFLINKNTNKWIILFIVLFFSINPVIPIICIVQTKDVLFSGFFIMATIKIYEFITNQVGFFNEKKNIFTTIIFITLACLFRNNAIYVFILTFIILLIIYRKNYIKISTIFLIPIILFYLMEKIIYPSLGIKEGDIKEKLSVPLNQISLVVVNHDKELSDNIKSEINQYINYNNIKSKYNYRFADPIKEMLNQEYYKAHKKEFWVLYIKLFKQHPKDYINAFINLSLPYHYIDADTIDPYSKVPYIEDIMRYGTLKFHSESKIPSLKKIYHKFASYEYFREIPVIKNIYSLSFPIWMIIFTIIVLIYKQQKEKIIVILPSLLLWLTYLLGPVSIFRYIWPLFLLYPIYLLLMLKDKENN